MSAPEGLKWLNGRFFGQCMYFFPLSALYQVDDHASSQKSTSQKCRVRRYSLDAQTGDLLEQEE